MKVVKGLSLGLVLGGMLLLGPAAHATNVSYLTTGTFTSSGTSQFSSGGVVITFTSSGVNNVTVPPASSVSFGTFTVTTTNTSFTPVSDTFTLTITQLTPTAGSSSFTSTLSGTIKVDNSQAFVQFASPLTMTIGAVAYSIASADSGTPGRVNLAPPTTNGGVSTIGGRINAAAVPEPSTILMLGLGAPALLVVMHRNRKRADSVA